MDEPEYDRRLRTLVRFFVMARVLREETLLGISADGGLAAVALVSRPDQRPSPASLAAEREATWAVLGDDARGRYEAFGEATGRFPVDRDHPHLRVGPVTTWIMFRPDPVPGAEAAD
ncbi:MAG TPA: hypothetical protein VK966_10590 [Longimicrobiales bacterium]|nr:hypothetical protein [Longimicrobiales bacterium]